MELDSRLFGERAKLSYFAVMVLTLVQFCEAVRIFAFIFSQLKKL